MRVAFVRALTDVAAQDERVVILAGDIGYKLFDDFIERFPGRHLNVGASEANMASVAAGMASAGFRPFIYTIAPFVTVRCLEQIRVDICYHKQPVVVVGVGAGYTYGSLGATHHAMEDIGTLRALPSMKVVCPGDPYEVEGAVWEIVRQDAPVYLRLGKQGEPTVHESIPDMTLGKGIVFQDGDDVTLISTGNMLPNAAEAAKRLDDAGVSTRLISMHTVKPLDEALILDSARRTDALFTIEEHSKIGGLGGAVAELLAESDVHPRFKRLAADDEFIHEMGEQHHLRKLMGLDVDGIVNTVTRGLNEWRRAPAASRTGS